MKKIFSFLLMAAMLLAMGASVASCSKDDESLMTWSEKWQEKRNAYWGEWHSRMQGIWVKEGEESNPNAPWLLIGKENIYSCCFFSKENSWNGIISFGAGSIHRIYFCRDVWSSGLEYELKFIDKTYRRMEAYYTPDGKKNKDDKEIWVKIDNIPSGWHDVMP